MTRTGRVWCGKSAATDPEVALRNAVLRWLAGIRTGPTDDVLEAVVNTGAVDDTIRAFDLDRWRTIIAGDVDTILRPEYTKAFSAAAGELIEIPADLTLIARAWASEYGLDLARRAVDPDVLRPVIVQALGEGWSIPRTSTAIRQSIGLDARSANALARYGRALTAAGVPDAQWVKRMEARQRVLTARRATNIARTETMRATNIGRLAGYQRARDIGALSPLARKVWVATESDRTCDECMGYDGVDVPLDDDFPGGVDLPPLHPSCRCTTIVTDPR